MRQLVARYTVVTYDRRGLSRSRIDAGAPPVSVSLHAGDAHRLLASLTQEPAFVFGTSIGAVLGLELVSRHPEQVRRLVAHEPPSSQLLPDADRVAFAKAQEDVEEVYRREGVGPAMQKFVALAGLDFADREPDVALPAPDPGRLANLTFFLTHDAAAVRLHQLDLGRLKAAAEKIVSGVGRNSRALPPGRCALALAALLGRPTVEFPGGHNGQMMHPKAFAAQLEAALTQGA